MVKVDNTLLKKLHDAYIKHGTLIVGVDFDDTIFAWDEKRESICKPVRKLLLDLKSHITICLYSVADEQSLRYKEYIMEYVWDIKPQYVNEGPIDKKWNSKKPFFNILLDDKAGLIESYNLLKQFKEEIL